MNLKKTCSNFPLFFFSMNENRSIQLIFKYLHEKILIFFLKDPT